MFRFAFSKNPVFFPPLLRFVHLTHGYRVANLKVSGIPTVRIEVDKGLAIALRVLWIGRYLLLLVVEEVPETKQGAQCKYHVYYRFMREKLPVRE